MSMSVKQKFAKVPPETKELLMAEYLQGNITQRELGNKYGFHYRQLACWFRDADRYHEYLTVNKLNRSRSAKIPMTDHARLKISGFNNIYWEGRKLDVKSGVISGVLIPAPDHPNKNGQGYVYEHRLVMEKELGRYLESHELVHHIDLNPLNNDPTNLLVLNSTNEHGKLHLCLQLALVKLLDPSELRRLTCYLLDTLRSDSTWVLAKNKSDKRKGYNHAKN